MQILELPAELLEDIIITIAQTNGSGLRSLRLVCRYFSTICLSHTVRNIIVDVWKFPAPRLLNQLSKNPGMAPLVTNLEVSCKYKTYRPLVSVLEQLSQLQTLSLKVQGADAELHPIEEHRGRVRLPSLRRVRVSCDNFSIPGLFLGVLWSSASYIHEVALYTPMQQVYSGARDDGTTSRPIGVSSLHLTFGHWAADVASALQVLNCFSQVEKATLQLWSPVHLNILAALTAVHGATLHILHLVRDLLPPFRGTLFALTSLPPFISPFRCTQAQTLRPSTWARLPASASSRSPGVGMPTPTAWDKSAPSSRSSQPAGSSAYCSTSASAARATTLRSTSTGRRWTAASQMPRGTRRWPPFAFLSPFAGLAGRWNTGRGARRLGLRTCFRRCRRCIAGGCLSAGRSMCFAWG